MVEDLTFQGNTFLSKVSFVIFKFGPNSVFTQKWYLKKNEEREALKRQMASKDEKLCQEWETKPLFKEKFLVVHLKVNHSAQCTPISTIASQFWIHLHAILQKCVV